MQIHTQQSKTCFENMKQKAVYYCGESGLPYFSTGKLNCYSKKCLPVVIKEIVSIAIKFENGPVIYFDLNIPLARSSSNHFSCRWLFKLFFRASKPLQLPGASAYVQSQDILVFAVGVGKSLHNMLMVNSMLFMIKTFAVQNSEQALKATQQVEPVLVIKFKLTAPITTGTHCCFARIIAVLMSATCLTTFLNLTSIENRKQELSTK